MILFFKKLWYRYILDRHLCEEFTQWRKKRANYERSVKYYDSLANHNAQTVQYTKIWQERQCTICGKTEQEDLAFNAY